MVLGTGNSVIKNRFTPEGDSLNWSNCGIMESVSVERLVRISNGFV